MESFHTVEPADLPTSTQIAIVVGRFNSHITESLLVGALEALRDGGIADASITVVRVPGCFELPLTIERLASTGQYAAVVALGCVIRGDTAHFDFVAGECSRGVSQAMQRHGLPVAFGVLTTETVEQALARAGGKADNKGADAAACALEMAGLMRRLDHA